MKKPTYPIIRAEFKGLAPTCSHPHRFENLLRGKTYEMRRNHGLWIIDETGKIIEVSNNALKEHFRLLEKVRRDG